MHFSALLKSKTTWGATLLVSGCCIGAGMIALPVVSAVAGFLPSSLVMVFCYLFTTATGLLLLEATLWFDKRVNLLSIAEFALGGVGKAITLFLFLFLFYCIFVAYLDGGGQLFAEVLGFLFHHPISRELGILACVTFVSVLTFAGTRLVDGFNRALLLGLVLSYCFLVVLGLPKIQVAHLQQVNWSAALATMPILLICFGFQNLVPTLTYYLRKQIDALRFAIIIGNFIPLIIYLLWNFVILGLLPEGAAGSQTEMITGLLQQGSQSLSVIFLVDAFSFFAILTSFLPSALSFVDFLRDGLKMSRQETLAEAGILGALVFIPPLVFSLYYPHLFLRALSFAGGFIDLLLFGVLPAVVVLIGRHLKKVSSPYQVAGGVLTPLAVLFISLFFLFVKLH